MHLISSFWLCRVHFSPFSIQRLCNALNITRFQELICKFMKFIYEVGNSGIWSLIQQLAFWQAVQMMTWFHAHFKHGHGLVSVHLIYARCWSLFVCSSCVCLMRQPSQGTKPYQAHYLSVCCILCAHVQFCRFDKADATAEVQWHCNHRAPLWYNFYQLRPHWVQISWSIGSKIFLNMCRWWELPVVQKCLVIYKL